MDPALCDNSQHGVIGERLACGRQDLTTLLDLQECRTSKVPVHGLASRGASRVARVFLDRTAVEEEGGAKI